MYMLQFVFFFHHEIQLLGNFRAIFEHLDADNSGQLDMGEAGSVVSIDNIHCGIATMTMIRQVRQCLSIMQHFGCRSCSRDHRDHGVSHECWNRWEKPKTPSRLLRHNSTWQVGSCGHESPGSIQKKVPESLKARPLNKPGSAWTRILQDLWNSWSYSSGIRCTVR